jgi:hypothetical protein
MQITNPPVLMFVCGCANLISNTFYAFAFQMARTHSTQHNELNNCGHDPVGGGEALVSQQKVVLSSVSKDFFAVNVKNATNM